MPVPIDLVEDDQAFAGKLGEQLLGPIRRDRSGQSSEQCRHDRRAFREHVAVVVNAHKDPPEPRLGLDANPGHPLPVDEPSEDPPVDPARHVAGRFIRHRTLRTAGIGTEKRLPGHRASLGG